MQSSYKFGQKRKLQGVIKESHLENVSDIKLQNMEKTDEEAGYSTIDEVAQQEPDKTVLSLEIMLINVMLSALATFFHVLLSCIAGTTYVLQPRAR